MASLVGPLYLWDVVRLARRGRGHALRFLFGAALLVALAFVYSGEFGTRDLFTLSGETHWISLHDQARFARAFANSLLLVQNIAVLVLVPAYLAGAVAEEKEKKTLDLLLTTALTDREIVLGKMLGRLMHVSGVLLVGLPVLSLAQLWGGLDVRVVLANFAVTGLTLLSVGGVSLVCSAIAKTALPALLLSFAASALLGVGCLCPAEDFAFSPLVFPFALDNRISGADAANTADVIAEMVTFYAAVHGGIGLIALLFAVDLLRPNDPIIVPPRTPLLAEVLPRPPPTAILLPEPGSIYAPSPPVGDNPLLWKEVLLGTGRERPRLLRELSMPGGMVMIVVGAVWAIVVLQWLADRSGQTAAELIGLIGGAFNVILRASVFLLLTAACLWVGFRAAGSIVRERARHTLDGLLTLPLSRETILRAKWLGSVLPARHLLYLVAAGWLVGICTGGLHPLALPLLVLTVAAQLAFVASLGLWVSVQARSIPRAHFVMAVLLLIFFGGGGLCGGFSQYFEGPTAPDFIPIAVTPWRVWWELMFPLLSSDRPAEFPAVEVGLLLGAVVVYLLAAAALWHLTVRRFKEAGGQAVARPPKVP